MKTRSDAGGNYLVEAAEEVRSVFDEVNVGCCNEPAECHSSHGADFQCWFVLGEAGFECLDKGLLERLDSAPKMIA